MNKSTWNLPTSDEEAITDAYAELRKGNLRWVKFSLFDDLSRIQVAERGGAESSYNDFLTTLDKQEICWALLRLEYRTTSGGARSKTVFFSWCHDDITRPSIRESPMIKSLSVMARGSILRFFRHGVNTKVEANDFE